MENNSYYVEIESYIKKNEIAKKTRILEENYDTLNNYWNIGRLIVEAQGGEARAKYGNELIKKWSINYTEKYGKGYNASNLNRFRQFYLTFPILAAVRQVSWSQIVSLLPIKDINKRNYYVNLCIKNGLSVRELKEEINANSYERLIDKPEKVEIVNSTQKFNITTGMKNPIIIELNKKKIITKESDLEVAIISNLNLFFKQLGDGYAFIGNQKKIVYNGNKFYIDILLFNINFNCYIVVELKIRELKKEDKGQIELYMEAVDKTIKKEIHNKTMGIIITKEQNKLIANFIRQDNIIPLIYEIS